MSGPTHEEPRDEHETFDELAVGWALHALEPEDEAAFAAHLAGCRRCAQTVAETAEVMAALAADLPPAEPSPALRDRLRAEVERTEQVPAPRDELPVEPPLPGPAAPWPPPPARPSERAPSRHPAGGMRAAPVDGLRPPGVPRLPNARPAWRRVLPHALVAAAVAAVLALGAWNVVLSSDRADAQAMAAERAEMIESLLEPGRATIAPLATDGEEVATVVAREEQVQVVADGLPVNDGSSDTYVVWGVPRSGAPVALGTFDVVSRQIDLRAVGSTETGLDDYSTFAVSIEPGREAPSEPTEIVASGQVTS
ncbi:anti-sigma factor domain-containing protein [Modestobacter lapidis]|nr:anti-sigma factor [Modestobacter lapidis]